MSSLKSRCLLLGLIGALSLSSWAQDVNVEQNQLEQEYKGVSVFAGLGLSTGGDKLNEYTLYYSNGDTSSSSMKAGGLVRIFAGVRYEMPSMPLSTKWSIGYHADSVSADNGTMKFKRLPIDGLLLYRFGSHEIGAGIAYHKSPKYTDMSVNAKFDDAIGGIFEYNYYLSYNSSLNVRFVNIEYTESMPAEVINVAREYFDVDLSAELSKSGNHAEIAYTYHF